MLAAEEEPQPGEAFRNGRGDDWLDIDPPLGQPLTSATARIESPVITGTIASPTLEPMSRPARRQAAAKVCEFSRRRRTR